MPIILYEDNHLIAALKKSGQTVQPEPNKPKSLEEEVKQYIRYIADRKLNDLGLDRLYMINKNPLQWLDIMINAKEHTNFFENRATEYAKGAVVEDWG